ncbi:hypothetical protein IFM89_005649 [Coptis chinensis]|uniref:Uncharacterized protein n=1 Tax=Coptis chinensis TaxID=261450 RepID=A0A835ITK7_9MAGN|nr:hypothetical protein IFM89_005649 [Coptis chinensis]
MRITLWENGVDLVDKDIINSIVDQPVVVVTSLTVDIYNDKTVTSKRIRKLYKKRLCLKVTWGTVEARWQMQVIYETPPLEEEFIEWVQSLKHAGRCMKLIWVPPINGQAETMFPPKYTSFEPIPKHTNPFGCLDNIILFSGLDESGNEKYPAQVVLDGHFAVGSLELGGGNGAAGVAGTTNVAVLLTALHL